MANPYVSNAATFLIHTLFSIYLLLVMLRFILQLLRADFYNPVSQFIAKATTPALRPLRRLIPGLFGIDTASVVLMFVLKAIELFLIIRISGGAATGIGLFVLTAAELLALVVNVFLFAIFIQVILSWINPGAYNPMTSLLNSITEPLLAPARRLIPATGGLDLSPMAVIIVLYLVSMLVVAPIRDFAISLM